MASHTMDDALINELVFKLGHLLPRERKHYSSLINNSEHIAYFVSHLQKYIERNFAKPLSENDLEDLIVMAADVRQILGSNVGAVCHEPPAGRAWIVFVNAIQGSSFLELEKINSHLRDEAKDHVMPEEVAAEIVKAYVSHNHVESSELSDLIAAVHASINNLDVHAASSSSDTGLTPPVPISKSVTPDYLISLEDGKKYKILKKHLAGRGLTPEEYRQKWNLPENYPMVAPNYSAQRAQLARTSGFGERRKRASARARAGEA
ncbi:MucR family transcriptional regulator [Methylobacterium variabile]|jgi:predicted transcriptional regulator|uniref:MucR family transcriptional regulator n=1 Tax=Methylobacterium variabile TaxID=298794 RepID=UPI000AFEA5F6|nr:MucR family transcriptional regulator [Methylobacterium variabile]